MSITPTNGAVGGMAGSAATTSASSSTTRASSSSTSSSTSASAARTNRLAGLAASLKSFLASEGYRCDQCRTVVSNRSEIVTAPEGHQVHRNCGAVLKFVAPRSVGATVRTAGGPTGNANGAGSWDGRSTGNGMLMGASSPSSSNTSKGNQFRDADHLPEHDPRRAEQTQASNRRPSATGGTSSSSTASRQMDKDMLAQLHACGFSTSGGVSSVANDRPPRSEVARRRGSDDEFFGASEHKKSRIDVQRTEMAAAMDVDEESKPVLNRGTTNRNVASLGPCTAGARAARPSPAINPNEIKPKAQTSLPSSAQMAMAELDRLMALEEAEESMAAFKKISRSRNEPRQAGTLSSSGVQPQQPNTSFITTSSSSAAPEGCGGLLRRGVKRDRAGSFDVGDVDDFRAGASDEEADDVDLFDLMGIEDDDDL
mmetsp:Transcript_15515/g.38440  ORF Transcript_15515/g.38440 Transcript_15515/m.38440 type:complete len:427 (-) Transcript_15515:171-1451(-)|eukprot:CAMPEP_0178989922 /NCGR_PEP_ID=MMETSP0795-20121207/4646_1 /TAXON_ID=88552 /ORGANISM="Amoebophrya sp., Strain Ameob2" /LENGTH=426 /DNA_ID=CAMNT_0020681383 /DNA_START=222 /DNA_END=1502 /DNA_ORIENTATION=+